MTLSCDDMGGVYNMPTFNSACACATIHHQNPNATS
jgi:hypothetical protein